MNASRMPWRWYFWHPHQGLWNRYLDALIKRMLPVRPLHLVVRGAVLVADTVILFTRALAWRIRNVKAGRWFAPPRIPPDTRITYLDIGTHTRAAELHWVVRRILPPLTDNFRAFGFEATSKSWAQARDRFPDDPRVTVIHQALCHQVPDGAQIDLYGDADDDLGASMHKNSSRFVERVPAGRLSDFINSHDLADDILLIRMNIEGAEFDVLRDLVDRGKVPQIDGFLGMWDDVGKIDPQRDREFRRFLHDNRIATFTFNGRDLRWSARRAIVGFHLRSLIHAALRHRRAAAAGR